MKSFFYCLILMGVPCIFSGCETKGGQGSSNPSSYGANRSARDVVIIGFQSAFGTPIPFPLGKEAPQSFFDPPKRLIEVRFQCKVSNDIFAKHFGAGNWRKTSVPRSIAELAPGFDFPTSERVATSFERTVLGWDYRIIRAWESEEVLMIAVLSEAHGSYKSNGLDY
ncbi:hypothetical protein [Prosthecobacter sp.]|uniref:hypothetical protein n=1 Tax=Prosthecobacter sp. TaxID=1965333 RepID=UPI003783255F